MVSSYTFERDATVHRMERIRDALRDGPLTAPEIAKAVHVSLEGLDAYIRHLRDFGFIYIKSWTRKPICGQRSYARAQYGLGNGPYPRPAHLPQCDVDAKRPKAIPKKEIQRRRRRLAKNNPETKLYKTWQREKADRKAAKLKRLIELGYVLPEMVGMVPVDGIVIGDKRRTATLAQVEQIIELRQKGVYWKVIADKVGVPISTAHGIYNRIMNDA